MRLFAIVALFPLAASANALDEGLHHLMRGDYQTAAQELATAVAKRPHDPIARFNFASALRELGRNEEAIGEYRAAFREGDDLMRGDALYGIAMTRTQEGDPARAEQAWREYIAFAHNRPGEARAIEIARENLAAAQHELGTRKAAR